MLKKNRQTTTEYPEMTGRPEGGQKAAPMIIASAAVVFLAVVIVILLYFVVPEKLQKIKEAEAEAETEMPLEEEAAEPEIIPEEEEKAEEEPAPEEEEEEAEEEEEQEEEEEEEPEEEEEDDAEFKINSSVKEDYSLVAHDGRFDAYSDPDIEAFSFNYPLDLFCQVECNTEDFSNDYGTHIKSVEFTGSEGSTLLYRAYKRNDTAGMKDAADYVFGQELKGLSDIDIVSGVQASDSNAFFILSGRDIENEDTRVYDMIRLTGEYVLQMRVTFPDYKDDDDKAEKDYYTECLYRSCGFTNSADKARSYEDYKDGVEPAGD